MLCLLEPLRSASGYGIFQRLPCGVIRPEFSADPVARPLSGDTCRCPSLPLTGARWEVLGPESGAPGSGLSSVTRAAAVSSVAKQEDWTGAQADLKGLPVSQLLELDHPTPSPKLGSPILPELALCSLSVGWPSGKGLPRTWRVA